MREDGGPMKPLAGTITTRWRTRRPANRPASAACRTPATDRGARRAVARRGSGGETMSKATRTTLEDLRLAIHGVTAPFACEGTFVPDKPVTFVFKDQARFEVVRAKNAF